MPRLELTEERVCGMMHHVGQGKAIVLDGVTDEWFKIGHDKGCRDLRKADVGGYCEHCLRKVRFAMSLLNHNYWQTA